MVKHISEIITPELRQAVNDAMTWHDLDELRHSVFEEITKNNPAGKHNLNTSIKDFRQLNLTVDEVWAGAYPIRAFFADEYYRRKGSRGTFGSQRYIRDDYDSNGIVIIKDFLLNPISNELAEYPLGISKELSNLVFDSGSLGASNPIQEAVLNPTLSNIGLSIAQVALRLARVDPSDQEHFIYKNTFVQKVYNTNHDGDVQKVPHMDTFYPCLKFWYFPDAVTWQHGPLHYSPGSHILSEAKLQWIYEQSIAIAQGNVEPWRTYGHAEGSFRASTVEIEKMGLRRPGPIDVPANTLVLANVGGFHCRGESINEGYRTSIHGSIRTARPFGH